jgi:mono/diheme cytochrome c family protein
VAFVLNWAPALAATQPAPQIARPSNSGGPGAALNLTGNATAGQEIFVANCQKCHGPQGQAGVNNPGSDDGTVPHLNPIDSSLVNSDPLVFAFNLDLFIEHGSTPSGSSPLLSMPAWGDQKKLTPQQIADVIAYVITLNPTVPVTATQAAPATQSVTVATDITQPLPQGDPSSGQQLVQTLACPACHISQGGGATLGPNWQPAADNNNQGIGTRAPLRITAADYKGKATTAEQYLFESIVAPDAYIVPGNPAYAPGGTSIMPHDFSTKMSAQNLADVIAYLQTIK